MYMTMLVQDLSLVYPLQPSPLYVDITSSTSDESDTESYTKAATGFHTTPNKIGSLQEMFPNVCNEQLSCLLTLLNGNMHKVISVCLEGLTIATILKVFKSVKMLTKVKKVAVRADELVQDALSIYKHAAFNVAKPLEIEIIGSQVVDLGGPRKQFFCELLDGLAKNVCICLFEGDYDSGYLLPAINHDAIIGGHFKMLGRIM